MLSLKQVIANVVAFGTSMTTQAFGDASTVGTAVTAARSDHKHGMPATPTDTNTVKEVSYANVNTSETTTSTSYTDLATAGPSITQTAVASDNLDCDFTSRTTNTGLNEHCHISPMLDAVAATDANSAMTQITVATAAYSITGIARHAGVSAASHTVKLVYKVTGGTGTFINRRLMVIRSQ